MKFPEGKLEQAIIELLGKETGGMLLLAEAWLQPDMLLGFALRSMPPEFSTCLQFHCFFAYFARRASAIIGLYG